MSINPLSVSDQPFFREDSNEGVNKMKQWCQQNINDATEYTTWMGHILKYAVIYGNTSIVQYIVDHYKNVLNQTDSLGRTALWGAKTVVDQPTIEISPHSGHIYKVYSSKVISDKTLACARILIEAGADMDQCMPSEANLNDSNPEQDERLFSGDNFLGAMVKKLMEELFFAKTFPDPSPVAGHLHADKLVKLLVAYGASCHIENIGPVDVTDDTETNTDKKEHVEILKHAKANVEDWSKARLISLAHKDKDSPLSALPPELVNKIHKHLIDLSIAEFKE